MKSHSNRSNKDHDEASIRTKANIMSSKVNERGTFGPIDDQAYSTQSEGAPKYILTEDLTPLENAEQEFKKAVSLINSAEDGIWYGQFESCNTLRKISKHHSSILL